MKRAKVSAVYEGVKGTKRSRGERRNARRGRIPARARPYGYRVMNVTSPLSPAPPLVLNERTIVTRSMAMTGNQQVMSVVMAEETTPEKKTTTDKTDDLVREEKNEEEEVAVVFENNGVMEKLEDWPLTWSYEEDWMWKKGSEWGMGWWEVMSDLEWVFGQDQNDNGDFWEDDIWFLKSVNVIPKP